MSRSRTQREHRRKRRATVLAILLPRLIAPLLAAWDEACWAFAHIVTLVISPRELAAREYIARDEHRRLADLIRHLELITRRIVLAAALSLNIVVRPLAATVRRARKRRRVLVWHDRPETWVTRPAFMRAPRAPSRWVYTRKEPPRVIHSFPLARRLEGVRRVLASPDAHIRRLAIRLARMQQRNATANEPLTMGVADWPPTRRPPTRRFLSRGAGWIARGMAHVMPVLESRLDRWNEAADPG